MGWGTKEETERLFELLNPVSDTIEAGARPILETLHKLDKPRNALSTGLYEALYGAPDSGFFSGLNKGWNQTEDRNLADIFGVKRPSSDMPWFSSYDFEKGYQPGWLGNAALHFGSEVVTDPLALLFAPAKAAGYFSRINKSLLGTERNIAGKTIPALLKEGESPIQAIGRGVGDVNRRIGEKLEAIPELEAEGLANLFKKANPNDIKDSIAGSNIASHFMHELPTSVEREILGRPIKYETVEDSITRIMREGSSRPLTEEALKAHNYMTEALKEPRAFSQGTGTVEDAVAGLQGLGQSKPQFTMKDVVQELERPGSFPELGHVAEKFKPLQDINEAKFDEWNALLQKMYNLEAPPFPKIPKEEIGYVPRVETQTSKGFNPKKLGDVTFQPKQAETTPSRELFKWEDLEGKPILRGFDPLRPNYVPKTVRGITEGQTVMAKDRGNYGRVTRLNEDGTATVHFVNKKDGLEATIDLSLDQLIAPTRKAGESELIGQPLVGKVSDPRTGVIETSPGQFAYVGPQNVRKKIIPEGTIVPVQKRQASLAEVEPVAPTRQWIDNPAAAYKVKTEEIQNKINYLRTLDTGLEEGWLHSSLHDIDGLRRLQVPGLEHLQTTPAIANRLENLAGRFIDRGTIADSAAGGLDALMNTRLGKAAETGTVNWKRNVLGTPAWAVANASSNVPQIYLGGVSPLSIPGQMYRTGKGQLGEYLANKGTRPELAEKLLAEEVLPGLTAGRLRQEGTDRGLFKSTWLGGEARDMLDLAARGEGRTGNFLRDTVGRVLPESVGEPIAQGAQKGADFWGRVNDWFLRGGGALEENAREVVMRDYLQKNHPDFGTLAPEAQALALDRATRHAKKSLIDYSATTPTETNVTKFAVPFYKWNRGILGRTAEVAATEPQKLNRFENLLETIFDPMDPQEKALAYDYVKESSPIEGVAGTPINEISDTLRSIPGIGPLFDRTGPKADWKQLFLMNRFVPQGNVEQLASRPGSFLWGALNPGIKVLPELGFNKEQYLGRTIDEKAGSGFAGLTNPIFGGDYDLAYQRRFGKQLPAALDYLISLSPLGRTARSADTLGRGFGLWEDPKKYPVGPGEALTKYLTGEKLYPFDVEEAKTWKMYAKLNKLGSIKKSLKQNIKKEDVPGQEFYADMYNRLFGYDADRPVPFTFDKQKLQITPGAARQQPMDIQMLMDQETTKWKALGFVE